MSDYPILYRYTDTSNVKPADRFKPVEWYILIANWPQMNGMASSKEEAMNILKTKFNERKNNGEYMHRPGTVVPLEYASSEGVEKYEIIASDVFKKILDMDYSGVFISDESSLWDFCFDDTLDLYYEKIKNEYGVDVSGTEGNLLTIFKKIDEK